MSGVSVNCWFCNDDSVVTAHAAREGWECAKCDQFNSFTPEGDVALPVSASTGLTRVRYNVATQRSVEPAHQLCHSCNLSQTLKSRQLANFRPIVEENWQSELDEYRAHLENIYEVCARCRSVVARALKEKDDMVRPAWLAWVKGLQQKMEAAAGTRLNGEVARSRFGKVSSVVSWGASLVSGGVVCLHNGGLALLLLLLLNGHIHHLTDDVLPEEYTAALKNIDDIFLENKSTLGFMCFTLWALMSRPSLQLKWLTVLMLWVYFCIAEGLTNDHISSDYRGVMETVLVVGLVACAWGNPFKAVLKKPEKNAHANGVHKSVHLRHAPISSSTPKTALNGGYGEPQLANGSLLQASTAATPLGVKPPSEYDAPSSPLALGKASSLLGSPSKRLASGMTPSGDTCSLLNLSLGSPRKNSDSRGVFALRTYTPDRQGVQLFARPRRVLSPARLQTGGGADLSHSAWIAGGYWQRGQPAMAEPLPAQSALLSRSSSQTSGFVDAYLPSHAAVGSVLGDDRHSHSVSPPLSPALSCGRFSPPGDQFAVPYPSATQGGPLALASPPALRYPGSQCGDCLSCSARSQSGGSPQSHLDSSSQLSARSSLLSSPAEGSVLDGPATNRSVLIALLLGFSVAFNMFAVLFLVFKDRL